MFVRNTRQTAISTSSAQHINNYIWKLYYKRFLEITLSLGIYKFLLYAVYTKVSSYLFGSDEDSFFYRRVHEYVVSMLMVHNVSCELFSQLDYRCTYIKYILIRSVRIFLLCYDSALISDCYGLDFTDINDTKRMCFYFFPGQLCFNESQICLWISNVVLSVLIFLKYSPLSRTEQLFPSLSFSECQEVIRFNNWIFSKWKRHDILYPAFISVIIHYFLGNALRKIFSNNFPSNEELTIFFFINIRLWMMLMFNIFIASYNIDMIFYFTAVIFTKPFNFFFNPKARNVCFKYPLMDALRSDLFLIKCIAYQDAYNIARFDKDKKAVIFKLIHIQDDRPIIWNTVLSEYFSQLNGFSRDVLSLHVNDIQSYCHLTRPRPMKQCANDIESFLKYTNEYKLLILVILTMAELSCESIKYHPPSIVHSDIHNVISKLFIFNKRLRQENVLNSRFCYIKIRKCYNLNQYLLCKNFEQLNQIYKCLKEVCETQMRKMMSTLRGHINMDLFTSSVQSELKKFMEMDHV
ncbi:hypothetical protein M8J77_000854 [Diaphorina citri]|nr:hypothetical protein M8J77_000854 [Diaphorina citri]